MFKNAGRATKFYAALIAWAVGAVPVITTYHTWQQIVAYAVPGLAAVITVYLLPNTQPAPVAQPDAALAALHK